MTRSVIAWSLVLALLVGACDTAGPTPSPTPARTASPTAAASRGPTATPVDPRVVLAEITREVEAIRGLRLTKTIEPRVIDEAQLRQILGDLHAKENPPELIAAQERLYHALGVLPEDESLGELNEELLGEQVAGFYVEETDELYVVSRSGTIGAAEKITFAHEYTHALQDQAFDLGPLTADAATQGDRALGRLALIEGDATLAMTVWAHENLGPMELLSLVGQAFGPAQAGLGDVPPFLRDQLLFPYQGGLSFVMGLQAQGGWDAVNAAFRAPPDTTEQVLHPDLYASDEPSREIVFPKRLAERMGAGWRLVAQDTLGEFQIRAWLSARAAPDAVSAAAGWAGDRVGVLEGPDGRWAVVIATQWDTPADAAEFAAAVPALANRRVETTDTQVRIVTASDGAAATEAERAARP